MGRNRTVNIDLPKGMYFTKNTYYFIDNNKKWISLGKIRSSALDNYYKLVTNVCDMLTMSSLFDRYMIDVSQKKSAASYQSDLTAMRQLRPVMAHMTPSDVTPLHIYQYIDYRSKEAPVRVNREIALLSHIFTKGIRWGAATTNPCRGVERNKEKPRKRYVTDNEFSAVRSILPDWLKLYVDLKYATGMRQSDLITLKCSIIKDEGLLIKPNKTLNSLQREILIEWTKELRAIVSAILILKLNFKEQPYLFVNRKGKPYTPGGFRSIWRRYMQKAIAAKIIETSFQERDIRAKTASDIGNLSNARLLLGHESDKTTTKFYVRLPQKVTPLQLPTAIGIE